MVEITKSESTKDSPQRAVPPCIPRPKIVATSCRMGSDVDKDYGNNENIIRPTEAFSNVKFYKAWEDNEWLLGPTDRLMHDLCLPLSCNTPTVSSHGVSQAVEGRGKGQ